MEKHPRSTSAGADCSCNLAESMVFFSSMSGLEDGGVLLRTEQNLFWNRVMSLAVVVAEA